MKRLTGRFRRWLEHRRKYTAWRRLSSKQREELRLRRPLAEVWTGEDFIKVRVRRKPMPVPKILCLTENPKETLRFLSNLRKKLLWSTSKSTGSWIADQQGPTPWLSTYHDFANIEFISAPVALILAAEYQRALVAARSPAPLINLNEWKPRVFDRFFELGFFPIVGLGQIEEGEHIVGDQERKTLRFLSGSDASEAEAADRRLLELAEFIDPDHDLPSSIAVPLNSALSEAMVNVRMHAYPSWHHFQFRPISRWWLTGTADRATRTLTVAIYDQGASIPVTYDRLPKAFAVEKFVRDKIGELIKGSAYASDAVHIEAAMRYGNSQSEKPNRGNGLPQMQDAVRQCGAGSLVVHSRGGRYTYSTSTNMKLEAFEHSIGGTLIEWTITLPDLEKRI